MPFSKRKFTTEPDFRFLPFFGLFLTKKGLNWQKWRKLAKSKPFNEIFWNLVCTCLSQKKSYKKLFFNFGIFWPFFYQKTAKIDQKWRKFPKSNPLDKIYWNLVCKRFSIKVNSTKTFFSILAFFTFSGQKQPKFTKNGERVKKD